MRKVSFGVTEALRHGALPLLMAVGVLLTCGLAQAQTSPLRVSSEEANKAIIKKVSPEYPEMARRMNLAGKVVMDATVDETGKVEDVKTISGNALLSTAAKKAVMQWTFTPFKRDGKPTRAAVSVSINFDPSS